MERRQDMARGVAISTCDLPSTAEVVRPFVVRYRTTNENLANVFALRYLRANGWETDPIEP
jgi:hypothetical protein